MFILDQPYVSDYLIESLVKYQIPVLQTPYTRSLNLPKSINFLSEADFIKAFQENENQLLYTNSENAIGWITEHLSFTSVPDKIDLFKDKVRFRDFLKPLAPKFFYKEIKFDQLENLDITSLPTSFVIKPAVGFFSLGVYKVENQNQWTAVRSAIQKEVEQIRSVYPKEVLDTDRFIIEEVINGAEFAFDAYFNNKGEAVLLSLLKHLFASAEDVSDRVYISSKEILDNYLESLTIYMQKIGQMANLKNFPVHVEVRIDTMGNIQPIEFNPLRTGGWCTTADMTGISFGFSPYQYLYKQLKPDWQKLYKGKEDKIYSNIVLTNSTGMDVKNIKSFNYDSLLGRFKNPLLLRKSNYKEFLIFGFLFAETDKSNTKELDWILHSDLKEFISPE
ncbi:MAG: ATP-grasp domain-containing protein [Bacteroidales bacterium]|nr:ATP-grasp domain-containing protein [Bacteroidales bacterium]MCF8405588.1 ATP-grasp domain-containing protein [Bacteroidales bacterium]